MKNLQNQLAAVAAVLVFSVQVMCAAAEAKSGTVVYPAGTKIEIDNNDGSEKLILPDGKVVIVRKEANTGRVLESINCDVSGTGGLIEKTAMVYVYAPSGLVYELSVNRNTMKKGADGNAIPVIKREAVVRQIATIEELAGRAINAKLKKAPGNMATVSAWFKDHAVKTSIKGFSKANIDIGKEVVKGLVLSPAKSSKSTEASAALVAGISEGIEFVIDQTRGYPEALIVTSLGTAGYDLANGAKSETDNKSGITKVTSADGLVEIVKTETDVKSGITTKTYPGGAKQVARRDAVGRLLEITDPGVSKDGKLIGDVTTIYVYGESGLTYEVVPYVIISEPPIPRDKVTKQVNLLEKGIKKAIAKKSKNEKSTKAPIVKTSKWFAENATSVKIYGFNGSNKEIGKKVAEELMFFPAKATGLWNWRDKVANMITGATDIVFTMSYTTKGGQAEVGNETGGFVAAFFKK